MEQDGLSLKPGVLDIIGITLSLEEYLPWPTLFYATSKTT